MPGTVKTLFSTIASVVREVNASSTKKKAARMIARRTGLLL